MKTCILLLLSASFLNSAEAPRLNLPGPPEPDPHEQLTSGNQTPSPGQAGLSEADFFKDEDDATEPMPSSPPSSPAPLARMSSSVLNKSAEEKYHESHPELFYATPEEKLSAKIKNLGKILRCGTHVDISRVASLLAQMPEILEKVRKNFKVILNSIKPTAEAYLKLSFYEEFVIDIERKINSSESLSVSDLLAVFGNINASIIEAQNIVSQLIKKRLDELSLEVQSNKGLQLIANGVSNKFEDKLLVHIRRINNATRLLDEFSNAQKHILSFSNLLQDFFLQGRTQEGKESCATEDLLTALKGSE